MEPEISLPYFTSETFSFRRFFASWANFLFGYLYRWTSFH